MSEAQVEPNVDPLSTWWADKKAPKSQLTQQLEGSLYIGDQDIPKEVRMEHAPTVTANTPRDIKAEETSKGINGSQRERKRRSDAGVSKGPKLVPDKAPAGTINSEQKAQLLMHVALVQQTTLEHVQAQAVVAEKRRTMDQAQDNLSSYLNSLSLPAKS